MLSIKSLCLVSLLLIATVGCSESKDKKSQENVQSAVDQHNSLINQVNSSGMPTSQWSDADIDAFEQKINRIEQLKAQIESKDGQSGIRVYGGDNQNFIQQARAAISLARQQKKQALDTAPNQNDEHTKVNELQSQDNPMTKSQFFGLMEETQGIALQIQSYVLNNLSTWNSENQLAFQAMAEKCESNLNRLEDFLEQNPYSLPNVNEMKAVIINLRQSLLDLKNQLRSEADLN